MTVSVQHEETESDHDDDASPFDEWKAFVENELQVDVLDVVALEIDPAFEEYMLVEVPDGDVGGSTTMTSPRSSMAAADDARHTHVATSNGSATRTATFERMLAHYCALSKRALAGEDAEEDEDADDEDTEAYCQQLASDLQVIWDYTQTEAQFSFDHVVDGLESLSTASEVLDTAGIVSDMVRAEEATQLTDLVAAVVVRAPPPSWLLFARLCAVVFRLTHEQVILGREESLGFWEEVLHEYADVLLLLVERLELVIYLHTQQTQAKERSDASVTSSIPQESAPLFSVEELLACFPFVRTGVQPICLQDIRRLAASVTRQDIICTRYGIDPNDKAAVLQLEQLFVYYLECIEDRCWGKVGIQWGTNVLRVLTEVCWTISDLEDALMGLLLRTSETSSRTMNERFESFQQEVTAYLARLLNQEGLILDDHNADELQELELAEITRLVAGENACVEQKNQLADEDIEAVARDVKGLGSALELLIEQEAPSFDEQNRCEREFPRNSDLKAQLSYIGSVIYFASKRRGKPIKARATQWFAVLFAVKECLSKHGELMEGGLASQTGIRASRFIQMHTGEGKALVIVIIAMYFSGRGYHVDIVTNSDQLALDAVREYGYLYSTFRSSCRALLTTSHNNKETVAVYEANIVYGTLLSFAADHLRESLSFRKVTGNRSRSLLIIDEVDSIVIDRATDSNMLSAPIVGSTSLFKVYGIVHQMVKSYGQHGENILPDVNDMRRMMRLPCASQCEVDRSLESKAVESKSHEMDPEPNEYLLENNEIPQFFRDMVGWKLPRYLENCASVQSDLKEGRHYLNHSNEIIPLDSTHSGEVMFSSTYSDGTQQFLQIVNQSRLSAEGLPATFLSNMGMINMYSKIIGLSGTVGDAADRERACLALREKLQPSFLFLPRHKPRKFTNIPAVLHNSTVEFEALVQHYVLYAIRKGRTVLLLCEDVNSGKEWHKKLSALKIEGVRRLVLYLTNDKPNVADQVAHELQPGDVVITTNFGSRGTDYKNHPIVVRNGGLFCVRVTIPTNERVRIQGDGRAGRAGEPGSAMILGLYSAKESDFWIRSAMLRELQQKAAEEESFAATKDIEWARTKDLLFLDFVQFHGTFAREICSDPKKALMYAKGIQDLACLRARFALFVDQVSSERMDALSKGKEYDSTYETIQKKWESFVDEIGEDRKHERVINNPFHLMQRSIDYVKLAYKPNQRKLLDFALVDIENALKMDEAAIAASANINMVHVLSLKHGKELVVAKYRDTIIKHLDASITALGRDSKRFMSFAVLATDTSKSDNQLIRQINNVLGIYQMLESNCKELIEKLKSFEDDSTIRVKFRPFLQDDPFARDVFFEFFDPLAFQGLLDVTEEKKWKLSWSALFVTILGTLQLLGGIGLMCFGFANVGIGLIAEAVSDLAAGIEGLVTGNFNLRDYFTNKAISVAISLVCGGIAKCCKSVAREGFRQSLVKLKEAGYRGFQSAKRAAWKCITRPWASLKTGVSNGVTKAKQMMWKLHGRILINSQLRHRAAQTMREAFKNGWLKHQNQIFKVVATKVVVKGVEMGVEQGLETLLKQLEGDIEQSVRQTTKQHVQSMNLLLSQFWYCNNQALNEQVLVQHACSQVLRQPTELERIGNKFLKSLLSKAKESDSKKVSTFANLVCYAMDGADFGKCIQLSVSFTNSILREVEEYFKSQISLAPPEMLKQFEDPVFRSNNQVPDMQRAFLESKIVKVCVKEISTQLHKAINMVVSRGLHQATEKIVAELCTRYIDAKGARLMEKQSRFDRLQPGADKEVKITRWFRQVNNYLSDQVVSSKVYSTLNQVIRGGPVQSRLALGILCQALKVQVVLLRDKKRQDVEIGDDGTGVKIKLREEASSLKFPASGTNLSHITPAQRSVSQSGTTDRSYDDSQDDLSCLFRAFHYELTGSNPTADQLNDMRAIVHQELEQNSGHQLLCWLYRKDPVAGGKNGARKNDHPPTDPSRPNADEKDDTDAQTNPFQLPVKKTKDSQKDTPKEQDKKTKAAVAASKYLSQVLARNNVTHGIAGGAYMHVLDPSRMTEDVDIDVVLPKKMSEQDLKEILRQDPRIYVGQGKRQNIKVLANHRVVEVDLKLKRSSEVCTEDAARYRYLDVLGAWYLSHNAMLDMKRESAKVRNTSVKQLKDQQDIAVLEKAQQDAEKLGLMFDKGKSGEK